MKKDYTTLKIFGVLYIIAILISFTLFPANFISAVAAGAICFLCISLNLGYIGSKPICCMCGEKVRTKKITSA